MSQFLVERANGHLATGQEILAVRDLEEVVELIEASKQPFRNRSIQDAFLADPTDTYSLLADAWDREGKSWDALQLLEQRRALNDSPLTPLPDQFHRELPAGTVILSYGVFEDRLLIQAIDSRGLHRTSVALPSARRERLVAAFSDLSPIAGRALHRVLIEPVASVVTNAKTIVFIGDDALRGVSFNALTQQNGRYLVQDHAIAVSSSIKSYLDALHRTAPTSRALLAVGNPALEARFKSLPDLTHAEKEAEVIAAMYPSRAMLLGTNATKERVIGALAYCDTAHFGVHAVAPAGDVPTPFLLLAESGNVEGKLFASEIAALDLDGVRTVFLAACRTAVGAPNQPQTRSLADAFLHAGVGSVVGSLREIEDAPTRELSIAFHRALRDGATPAEALRAAQVAMIRAKGARSDWASLQLYGSGL